jgi:predicted phosphodiesterase
LRLQPDYLQLLAAITLFIDASLSHVPAEITRVISDLHYGDRATRALRLDQLSPLLENVECLVLNGDSLDTRPGPFPAHTASCLAEVQAFFGRAKARITFLTGNHDADISAQHRLDLAGGQVFVTHGDIVFDDIVPWGRDASVIRERIGAELSALPVAERDDLDRRLAIWRRVAASIPQRHQSERHGLKYTMSYLADTLLPPDRILKILRAWRVEPPAIAELARRHRPRAKFILTGHLHRPSIWRSATGTVVVNTGTFCRPFGAYAVDVIPECVTVRRIEMRAGEFYPGRTVAEFPLAKG